MRLEMKTANQQGLLRRSRALLLSGGVSAVVFAAACMGNIGGQTGTGGNSTTGPGATSGGANGSGSTVASSGDVGGMAPTQVGTPGSGASSSSGGVTATGTPQALDPGTVGMHRLNAFEYDNTINDLLGLQQNLAETSFIPDEKGVNGF